MLAKMKISEKLHVYYIHVMSQLIVFGAREIAQGEGEIFPKVSAKCCEKYWITVYIYIYNFSISLFGGKGREIAQGGGKILPSYIIINKFR